jgi:hypothetical protein
MSVSEKELWSIINSNDAVALQAFCQKYPNVQCLTRPESGSDGFAPIFAVCLNPNKAHLLPILIKYGNVNVNELSRSGFIKTLETPLHMACIYGNVPAATELLKLGADKTIRDWRGFSSLDAVCFAKMKCKKYGDSLEACEQIQELLGGEKQCSVCFTPCTLSCGQCNVAYYCSQSHQKQNWADHKKTCNMYCKAR